MTQEALKENGKETEPDFNKVFKSKFYGVLRWHQLDVIWDAVKKEGDSGWYLYEVDGQVPDSLTSGKELNGFIDELDKELRTGHDEDYCGIVYTDDLKAPSFIKVFDPSNLGTSCSIGTTAPPPKWIISKLRPEKLSTIEKKPQFKKRWLGNLFSKK